MMMMPGWIPPEVAQQQHQQYMEGQHGQHGGYAEGQQQGEYNADTPQGGDAPEYGGYQHPQGGDNNNAEHHQGPPSLQHHQDDNGSQQQE
jgi:hypothetical protein